MSPLRAKLRRVQAALPTGRSLAPETWQARHRVILILLWLHVAGIFIFGVRSGYGVVHPFLEASLIGIFAASARVSSLSREVRASLATVGLVMCSAILVHLSGGTIEMHFHFFVVVAIVALYQSWIPFLLAIGFVLLHHGVIGVLDSSAVYNHPDALANPWKWAAIHALFIAGESAAALTTWKLNELALDAERRTSAALEVAISDLAEAQTLTHIGSWDWSIADGTVFWSDELYRICGKGRDFVPTYDSFLDLVAAADRSRLEAIVEISLATGSDFDDELTIELGEGVTRLAHALGRAVRDEDGNVIRLTGTLQDVTQRRQLEDRVRHQAFHDALTDLPHRELFHDRVEHARTRRGRNSSSMGVLFVDLDDLKSVNDTKGHRAGDRLLVEVSRTIESILRPEDTVARLGGDEFAILLEEIDNVEEATDVAERIIAALSRLETVEYGSTVSASVGVVIEPAPGVRRAGELLRDSDVAMYAAKRAGKGRFEVFDAAMREELASRLALRSDLQRAIDENELFLQYQPIVCVGDERISGVEALVRWRHPERGVVPPLEFIPFAEESSQIVEIGRWVLREACAQAAAWHRASPAHPLRVSVNVSPLGFRQESFVHELKNLLEEFSLAPSTLVLEITEGVFLDSSVAKRLDEIKRLGVRLAIDDFGTGYSSLAYLQRFPVDFLKMDKIFVDQVATGAEGFALASAVVKLGDALGMNVVAEGVETRQQADALREMGCDLEQGYLFSRPVDPELIEGLIAEAAAAAVAPGTTPDAALSSHALA